MKIIAIKRGNILELSEALDIPDGQAVAIEIAEIPERSPSFSDSPFLQKRSPTSEGERFSRLMDFLGVGNKSEEVDGDRLQQFGRDIDSLDD